MSKMPSNKLSFAQYNEIVEQLRQQTKPIHLIIQNLVLKGMSFRDAHQIVHEIQNNLDAPAHYSVKPPQAISDQIDTTEWIVPHNIDEFTTQLMTLHEKFSMLSFGFANRTIVKIDNQDNFQHHFILRRGYKSDWTLGIFSIFALKGSLIYQNPSETKVIYQLKWNWLYIGIYLLLSVLSIGNMMSENGTVNNLIWSIGMLMFIIFVIYNYVRRQKEELNSQLVRLLLNA